MMKRLSMITLLLVVLALPAQAATFFPDGNTLHRDPFCVHHPLSLESCFAQTLDFTNEQAQAAGYLLCTHCTLEDSASAAETADVWYYNPNGGSFLHRDPACPSVSQKYRPMLTVTNQTDPASIPDKICSFCSGAGRLQLSHLLAAPVWDETPENKAKYLPGVWTLPSADAITQEKAIAIGKAEAHQYSGKSIHSALAAHYDHDPQGNPRESWYVLVTTVLQHPVCLVHIDALSGVVYSTIVAEEFASPAIETGSSQIEILADRVNFREEPHGEIIGKVNQGDVLTLRGEVLSGLNLWYCAESPEFGEGYVLASFAQIVHDGKLRGNGSPLTEQLLAYYADLRRLQIANGYLIPDGQGNFVIARDQSIQREAHKVQVALLMYEHSIIGADSDREKLLDPSIPSAEKEEIARRILTTHYGVHDLFFLISNGDWVMPGIYTVDWHSNEMPTSQERLRQDAVRQAVDQDFQ